MRRRGGSSGWKQQTRVAGARPLGQRRSRVLKTRTSPDELGPNPDAQGFTCSGLLTKVREDVAVFRGQLSAGGGNLPLVAEVLGTAHGGSSSRRRRETGPRA